MSSSSAAAFEVICLGTGGGPLENDVSGYMVKRAKRAGRDQAVAAEATSAAQAPEDDDAAWTDGWVSIEGGAGMGCLAQLLAEEETQRRILELEAQVARLSSAAAAVANGTSSPSPAAAGGLFDDVVFPPGVDTPILKAAYLFGYLTAYVITHAHLDHLASMIIHTGSLSCSRATTCAKASSSGGGGGGAFAAREDGDEPLVPTRIPIYASTHTLQGIDKVYNGETWPALAAWSPSMQKSFASSNGAGGSAPAQQASTSSPPGVTSRLGAMFKKKNRTATQQRGSSLNTQEPYPRLSGVGVQLCPTPHHQYQRLPRAGLSIMEMPVAHGHNDQGTYHSSAFFVRRDDDATRAEFLFWGDVGSKLGDDDAIGDDAPDYNRAVWKEAASRWDAGRLRAVFIECSYDSSRPNHLMFGHLIPTTLYGELATMATLAKAPLTNLLVFVTHIKESLIPGTSARQKIAKELAALEASSRLGLRFQVVERGTRLRF